MKQIELVPGIKSSVLGFGCAPIKGSVGNAKAERALATAIDKGITHFDIARSYGYGDAEAFVGKLLKPYRNDVIIATKFGIKANNKAKLLAPLKPIVRFLKSLNGNVKHQAVQKDDATTIADRFHYRIDINPNEMRKSLDESLKALKTDYVDYFFVHEPLETIRDIDALIGVASDLKREGKIRAFGLAYMQNQKHLHEVYLDRFDVLQYNNSPGMSGYEEIKAERNGKANIFFSPINGGSSNLSPGDKLLKLHEDFNQSIILCSMFSEKHLESNAKLFL